MKYVKSSPHLWTTYRSILLYSGNFAIRKNVRSSVPQVSGEEEVTNTVSRSAICSGYGCLWTVVVASFFFFFFSSLIPMFGGDCQEKGGYLPPASCINSLISKLFFTYLQQRSIVVPLFIFSVFTFGGRNNYKCHDSSSD